MNCIVAVTRNWGIGKDGCLLHSIPEDMKFFRQTTLGSAVLMGRATLDSFPGGRPLPKRTNIVLTRDPCFSCEGVLAAHSVEEALDMAKKAAEEQVFVIGGDSIYRQLLPFCSVAYVTKMDMILPADTFFPNLDQLPDWTETDPGVWKEHDGISFRFAKYERK